MMTWPIMAGVMTRVIGSPGRPGARRRKFEGGAVSETSASRLAQQEPSPPPRARGQGEGEPDPHYRWFQGGVGKRGLPLASSSGHTMTRLPSCHWSMTILWAIWKPSGSTA